jgi:hypothetical protein
VIEQARDALPVQKKAAAFPVFGKAAIV